MLASADTVALTVVEPVRVTACAPEASSQKKANNASGHALREQAVKAGLGRKYPPMSLECLMFVSPIHKGNSHA